MIRLLTLFCILFSPGLFAQVGQPDSLLPYSVTLEQEVRTDSFVFVAKTYALPRKCNRKNQSNCCSYRSNPDQVGCYDGTTMFWTFMPNVEMAKFNVDNVVIQREKQYSSFEKKSIICFLMGLEVPGYQINYETKEGGKGSTVITSGMVNDQAILIELHTSKPLKKNKDIQPVFRQIIRLKE
jgi:hypothetical protein